MTRCDYFRFGSVFIKKSNQTEIIIKKKTETEPKPSQTDRFRFGFFRGKTGSNRFGSVLARFSGLARFFLVSVRFFWFFAYKTETKPNRPVFSKF